MVLPPPARRLGVVDLQEAARGVQDFTRGLVQHALRLFDLHLETHRERV